MKYLFAGQMKEDEFNHLISMSNLRSEGIINSIRSYLVLGFDEALAILGNEVSQGNFSRDLKKVEALFKSIQKYNEITGVKRIS
jgi:hypothetical protein